MSPYLFSAHGGHSQVYELNLCPTNKPKGMLCNYFLTIKETEYARVDSDSYKNKTLVK